MFDSVEIEILILDLSSLILALWNSLGTSWKLILIFFLNFLANFFICLLFIIINEKKFFQK